MHYRQLLRDPRWQKKRLQVLERDAWTCQACGATDRELHVHHLAYGGKPWEVPDSALVTLCRVCHQRQGERRPPLTLDQYVSASLQRLVAAYHPTKGQKNDQ